MNYASLIGIHRLKTAVSAGFKHLRGNALREAYKRFLAFLAVISYIKRNLVIASAVVCCKTGKILKRVKSFAAVTDYGAESFSVKLNKSGVFLFGNLDFNI